MEAEVVYATVHEFAERASDVLTRRIPLALLDTAAAKTAKAPRAGTLQPSPQLAAVIGTGPFGRGEVMKLLWDYIKAHNL